MSADFDMRKVQQSAASQQLMANCQLRHRKARGHSFRILTENRYPHLADVLSFLVSIFHLPLVIELPAGLNSM